MDITLVLSVNKTLRDDGLVRLQVWVSEASNCPPQIFLVRHVPLSPESSHTQDAFIRSCNYADLLNYSTAVDDYRQHYRVSSLDLLFTSIKDATDFEALLKANADNLCNDIAKTTNATPAILEIAI
jgi:hypothetical protein